MNQAFRTYCILLVFVAAITFPFLNSSTQLVKDVASFENRAMAKKPAFDVEHLDPFPAKYDTFYNDHFNLRNRLIRYFNIYNIRAYRKSPVPSVVIGKDGWLYVTGDEMDSYMGKNRLTETELLSIRRELEYRKNYLEERGIKFYFLVIPCKASIHSDKIGYEYFRMHKDSWGEELNNYLQQSSTVKPVDVFDSLRKQAKNQNLYYKLDNHWNDLGAFYTANQVFRRMHADFPSVHTLPLQEYTINNHEAPAGNLEKMLGNLGIFSEAYVELLPKKGFIARDAEKAGYPPVEGFVYPWEYELVKEINDPAKPTLLIIGDSFGKSIFPFLAENFSKTVKIFDSWQYRLNEEIVHQEKPAAVLLMIDEPILRNLLHFQSRTGKK